MSKKPSFWIIFWIIVKCSFISFGGGNAVFPVLKEEFVVKRNWLSVEEFNGLIIKSNLLPGPSVVEAFAYLSFKFLGFWKGFICTFIATLPHVFFFFGIFIAINFLPTKYLWVISVGVLPTIAGIVLAFTVDFIKKNKKSLRPAIFWTIFFIALCATLFLPTPFNAPVFVMIILIGYAIISDIVKTKKAKKNEQNSIENIQNIENLTQKNTQEESLISQNEVEHD